MNLIVSMLFLIMMACSPDFSPQDESSSSSRRRRPDRPDDVYTEPRAQAGHCDDPDNPMLVNGQCYRRCDWNFRYCLRHDEMASQLDPDKTVPLCSFESGRILIDDQCGRGVLTVDSTKNLFRIGNDLTETPLQELNESGFNPGKYTARSRSSRSDATIYQYPSNYPMISDDESISLSESMIRVEGAYSGRKDHPKMTWILKVNGHVFDTKDISAEDVKNFCQAYVTDLSKGDDDARPEVSPSNPQSGTYSIYCDSNTYKPGDLTFSFFCHVKEDRCFLKYVSFNEIRM
ncbi:MAG: hypothetical protein H6618_05100 [Deltaproteobacteria bacterium]|nr:hypothetical protein [Deltaproteobacteria bacterium]